jgi:hypothetical protein
LPFGETLICVKGPMSSIRSSDSVASTTWIVWLMLNKTSTDLESVYAGGMSVQE